MRRFFEGEEFQWALPPNGKRKRGQCGLARPHVLAGESPAWVIASHEPSIEPCGLPGNGWADA